MSGLPAHVQQHILQGCLLMRSVYTLTMYIVQTYMSAKLMQIHYLRFTSLYEATCFSAMSYMRITPCP